MRKAKPRGASRSKSTDEMLVEAIMWSIVQDFMLDRVSPDYAVRAELCPHWYRREPERFPGERPRYLELRANIVRGRRRALRAPPCCRARRSAARPCVRGLRGVVSRGSSVRVGPFGGACHVRHGSLPAREDQAARLRGCARVRAADRAAVQDAAAVQAPRCARFARAALRRARRSPIGWISPSSGARPMQ